MTSCLHPLHHICTHFFTTAHYLGCFTWGIWTLLPLHHASFHSPHSCPCMYSGLLLHLLLTLITDGNVICKHHDLQSLLPSLICQPDHQQTVANNKGLEADPSCDMWSNKPNCHSECVFCDPQILLCYSWLFYIMHYHFKAHFYESYIAFISSETKTLNRLF